MGFACEVQAKCGTQNTVIPAAIRDRPLRACAPGAWPSEVLTDARGRATGVAYFDARDRLQTQDGRPRRRVGLGHRVGAPAAELEIRSLFPTGLGNRHDWVGRNLQGHAYSGA